MWEFPRNDEVEVSMKVDLWAGVTLNGWRPRIWCGGDGKFHLKLMKLGAFMGVQYVK
jgi:hypothetical protein